MPIHRLAASAAIALAALSATPASAGEVQLQHQGLTLNAELSTTGEDWANGPVVLLTHGTLAHNGMEIITTLQGLLAERGISSLAPSLSLGLDDRHGMYDCNVPHSHQHSDAVTEIGLWLDWLKARGADQLVLAGHSRGGAQTAWFAAERPDPAVRAVALIAPATWTAESAAASYQKQYGVPLAEPLGRAQALVDAGKGETWLEDIGFIYCEAARVQAQAFLGYYAPDARFDTPGLLDDIAVPVLVIAGAEDRVVPDVAERVAPLADGERLRLVEIDLADHFFRDLAADDVADAIQDLIDGL